MTSRLLLLLIALTGASFARPAREKPNIIVVFLDDCGYGDFSHTGNPTIHTPNITRMVSEGLNFPQFYTASGACTASRYALLTGRNPRRSGFGRWVLSPRASRYLHPHEITLAEGLRNQGYATGFFGKWHLGNPNSHNDFTPDSLPLAHGFDLWEGTNVSNDYDPGADLIRSDPDGTTPVAGYTLIAEDIIDKQPLHEELTKRYRDRALQFISDQKENPFLLYLAPNMPHLPVFASSEFKGQSLRGRYGDCIEEIDEMMGAINTRLAAEGIAENTLVVFTSDNGPWIRFQDTASHPKYDEARLLIGTALPFRDGKGSTWEGGVRVPGVWYWPGTIEPATVVRDPASTMDLLPTLFALAGEDLPTGRTLDGRDIRAYLNREIWSDAPEDFSFIYTGASSNKIYGARKGAHKLHIRLYSQTGDNYGFTASRANPLLFNVQTDPHERYDLSDSLPGIVSELNDLISGFENSLNEEGTFWGNP